MQSPPPPITTTTTYTTIPISGGDVIYRSIQNASSFVSSHRPWSELISSDVFDRPESLSIAGNRIRKNTLYFRINYGILIVSCAVLSLIGSPFSMIVFALIFGLWLVLYLFREDPLVLKGRQVSDRVVLFGLILTSVLCIWLMGLVGNLMLGIGIGLMIMTVHGVLRNPEGLFLDEEEAFSRGLIGSGSGSGSSSATQQQQQQQQHQQQQQQHQHQHQHRMDFSKPR